MDVQTGVPALDVIVFTYISVMGAPTFNRPMVARYLKKLKPFSIVQIWILEFLNYPVNFDVLEPFKQQILRCFDSGGFRNGGLQTVKRQLNFIDG